MSNNLYDDDYDTHCITGPVELTPGLSLRFPDGQTYVCTVPEERAGFRADHRWEWFHHFVHQKLSAAEQEDCWRCYNAAGAGVATTQELDRQAEYHKKIGWEGSAP